MKALLKTKTLQIAKFWFYYRHGLQIRAIGLIKPSFIWFSKKISPLGKYSIFWVTSPSNPVMKELLPK
ncbi:hypothetical protein QWT87_19855 [Chryseobacterium sp. APV1]|uniref:Uncharacterized protein n=1 Tax=Chryseobacterium urinae TaxID=3058400 RepID=A0ABT8U7V5_9FLAO|nr:hypothetical protein [Chryseobacterium sp. APV1]MDO3427137.1 hypothetical protein [Chryseobacterium sp. APV1]